MKQISIFIVVLLTFIFASPAVVIAQGVQKITGHIYDEASGQPLTGVVVVLLGGKSGEGAATDIDGNFELKVPLGRHALKITYTGYEDKQANDIVVTAGKEVKLNIGMLEALHKLEEVTVKYNKAKDKTRTNNDMAQVSARSFNVDETKRYAGSLGDPSRMAANFAGVVSGNDSRNDIVVKGNSPTGMLWQLEGLNIPNPNHYGSLGSTGGPVSMLNNNNIDKSDFMTSAFPAQYGNALAGVFDIKLREGNRNKNEYVCQVGFNGFEVGAEGPLGAKKKTSYLFNYRYSTLGVFQKMGINFGTGAATPLYQDVNYKITTQLDKKSVLTAFGIAGSSSIAFMGGDIDTAAHDMYGGDPYSNEVNKYATTISGISYGRQLTDKTYSKLTLGYCTTRELYEQDSISNIDNSLHADARVKFATGKASAVWMLRHKLNAQNNIEAGITYDLYSFNLLNKGYDGSGTEHIYVKNSGSYGLAQGYTQWKHRFNNKLSTVAGLHGQYLGLNNAIAVEPRASVRYALSARQAISAGYGLHHQAQPLYTYFVETPAAAGVAYTNRQLGFTRSNHTAITYDWNINNTMRLKAEAYYQWLNNVPVERSSSSFSLLNTGASFGPSEMDSLVNKGKGNNYGAELTLERFFDKGYYFLLTGSLFQSNYSGSDGVARNTAFNTGYVLNALAGREWRLGKKGSVLALNLKMSSVGGRYLTPVDVERSKTEGRAVYRNDIAFSQKQPAYFRTDLRIAYRKEYRKSTLEVAIDLQNVTNHQNIFGKYYDGRTGTLVTSYQQSFFPVPMVKYTF